MEISKIIQQFEQFAPLSLSYDAQKNLGAYDNSGLILEVAKTTDCVVCALDLTSEVVDYANSVNAKLIITHHPAIYRAVKNVGGTYVKAIQSGISVYSAHLNLDSAKDGIEDKLASFAGASDSKILSYVSETNGFGRIFSIPTQTAENVVNRLIGALATNKYMFFGDLSKPISTVATFCGAGLGESDIYKAKEADMLISADVPHHVLLSALEQGKCVMQLTHYASEVFAMKEIVENLFNNQINLKCYFYTDKRFL